MNEKITMTQPPSVIKQVIRRFACIAMPKSQGCGSIENMQDKSAIKQISQPELMDNNNDKIGNAIGITMMDGYGPTY